MEGILSTMSLILYFVGLFWAAPPGLAPVKIESGLVAGVEQGDVRVYKGIPYAAGPVGELRWKPPRRAAAWNGVRAADRFGASCMQVVRAGVSEISEDCLTLNVWTGAKTGEKLPVMFWIYGGAFVMGSSAVPIYDGAALARQGVVVVSINYRVGDFGFFAHPALSDAAGGEPVGNYGLMDQVAALEWVERNIAALGGDPRQVTIFGESAGGMSVNDLMVSPKAKGLFQRAISESGLGLNEVRPLSRLEDSGKTMAADLGVAGAPDPIAALKAIPAKELLAGVSAARAKRGGGILSGGWGPALDGQYLPAEPGVLFAQGKQHRVPYLAGSNSWEASLMATFSVPAESTLAGLGAQRQQAVSIYEAECGGDQGVMAAWIYTDGQFGAAARYLAAHMEKVNQPAWLYHFSYVSENRRGKAPGAAHGAEIQYVFNNLRLSSSTVTFTAADRAISDRMSAYWVRFAKTGNPNPPGKTEWPAYKASSDELLEFGETVAVRKGFRKAQLDFHEGRYRGRIR